MKEIEYSSIVNDEKISRSLKNTEFKGFDEDYYVIQSLLFDWQPNHIFEIGTNTGNGCRIMNHASPNSKITTLDIMPICGNMCPPDVIKICGDSMEYNFEQHYPIDCWFIDGNHVYENAYKETTEAIKSGAKYIIYHDGDIEGVYNGIVDSFKDNNQLDNYDLYQVINPTYNYSSTGKNVTRIVYAIKK
jgi:hypothetical protein